MSGFKRVGRGSRVMIGAQVLLAGSLALLALVMVNWLAGRPGVRQRFDLTAKERNSLDPATELVLGSLPETVKADVFFRAERPPLGPLVADVQGRTLRLLALMEASAAGRIEVRENDLSDAVATQERLTELRIRGFENCVVFSQGDRVEVVSLYSELAQFDIGNPDPEAFKPASILAFNGERALVEGIVQVTRGVRPRVLFLEGHGERDLMGEDQDDLGRLHATLRDDGLALERWNRVEEGPFPEDTSLIAVVGPTAPLGEDLMDELEAFADGGGRLLLAPAPDVEDFKRSGIGELAERFGMEIGEGTVLQIFIDPASNRPFMGARSQVYAAQPRLMRRHPILDPFRGTNTSFQLSRMHPVRVARQVTGGQGVTMPLLGSDASLSWLDDPYPLDFQIDEATEDQRAYDLMAASQYMPEAFLSEALPGPGEEPAQKVEARVLVLGSSDLFLNVWHTHNAEFALQAFNWLTDREWRVSVSPKDPDRRILPEGDRKRVIHLALWILPLLSLMGGLLTAFRRSRG